MMPYDQALEIPGRSTDDHPTPAVLVACEDPVLLRAVERVISWQRPDWNVDGVVGPEATSQKLSAGDYRAVVVCIEVDSPAGAETLRLARILCPEVRRVAYSIAPCNHPEVALANERVTGAPAVGCLVSALDRVVRASPCVGSPERQASPTPSDARIPAEPTPAAS